MTTSREQAQLIAETQPGASNQSDQPEGVENYKIEKLVGDVRSVIQHFKRQQAIVVGHDWGGMVAWQFAMSHPEMT